MKAIVKQIFHILADIILAICWGGMVIMNSIYCANANENRWGFIVPIVFSSILLIVNIISLFVDIRELNNLCNSYDDKLKQIFLFIEKENNVQGRKIKHSCGFEWDDLYKYKGYITIANYSKEDKVWYGQIENIRDLVNWESETVDGIEQAFKDAVDDYIEFKKEMKK